MTTSGTKEWATSNVNWIKGCTNDCLYCYARQMAKQYNRIENNDEWSTMHLVEKNIKKGYKKRVGRIMHPTTHDITLEVLQPSLIVIEKLLAAGNELLITSKPHFECIKKICDKFVEYQDQIQFRFTITTFDNDVLAFWEPNAPKFEERLKSLKYAYSKNYKTSISCEPILTAKPLELIRLTKDYITESFWIGKMNHFGRLPAKIKQSKEAYNVLSIKENIKKIIKNQVNICKELEDFKEFYPKIRFKDSLKSMVKIQECKDCVHKKDCEILNVMSENLIRKNLWEGQIRCESKEISQKAASKKKNLPKAHINNIKQKSTLESYF